MSRQEDFKQASQSLEIQVISNPWTLFEKGCEHGYQYAVKKACEWLRENIYHRVYECGDRLGYPTADFLKDFRKAMQ